MFAYVYRPVFRSHLWSFSMARNAPRAGPTGKFLVFLPHHTQGDVRLVWPRRGSQRSASSPKAHRRTANLGTAPTCDTGVCASHSRKAKDGPRAHLLREILEER